MHPGILIIAAIAMALLAVAKNAGASPPFGRASFAMTLLVVSAPLVLATACDVFRMVYDGQGVGDRLTYLTYIFMAVVAYPFYQRVYWRANDAGAPRYLCYLCLIPYLNVVVFAYLCLRPTAPAEAFAGSC